MRTEDRRALRRRNRPVWPAAPLLAALAAAPACTDLSSDCQLNASCPDGNTGGAGAGGKGTGGDAGIPNGGHGGQGAGPSTGGGGTITGPSCGDGHIDPREQCDDQNLDANDGCSSLCVVESGWFCTGEPSQCSTSRPPYVMIAVDTSASMIQKQPTASSCGYGAYRIDHVRCALKESLAKHEGKVRFGLTTFAETVQGCAAGCFNGCNYVDVPGNTTAPGCGPRPGTPLTRAGAYIRVGVPADNPKPAASNLSELLSWMDNQCADNRELFAHGDTPINGALRDMFRYFELGWQAADGQAMFPSPVTNGDSPTGTGCLSLNVLLITDGDETCDAPVDAISAASDLYNGVDAAGHLFPVKTHVITMASTAPVFADELAFAGGTSQSRVAQDDVAIKSAIDAVVASLGCN